MWFSREIYWEGEKYVQVYRSISINVSLSDLQLDMVEYHTRPFFNDDVFWSTPHTEHTECRSLFLRMTSFVPSFRLVLFFGSVSFSFFFSPAHFGHWSANIMSERMELWGICMRGIMSGIYQQLLPPISCLQWMGRTPFCCCCCCFCRRVSCLDRNDGDMDRDEWWEDGGRHNLCM